MRMRIAIRECEIRELFWPFWRMRKNSFVEIDRFYKILAFFGHNNFYNNSINIKKSAELSAKAPVNERNAKI